MSGQECIRWPSPRYEKVRTLPLCSGSATLEPWVDESEPCDFEEHCQQPGARGVGGAASLAAIDAIDERPTKGQSLRVQGRAMQRRVVD